MKFAFKPWLVLAGIFVVGAVTGSVLTLGWTARFPHPRGQNVGQMNRDWMMFLTRRLDLSPDQQAKIGPILNEAGTQLQSVHREEVDRAGQIMATANEKIAAVLTEEQQRKLRRVQMEMDRNRDKLFPGRPRPWRQGGPGGPGGMGMPGRPGGMTPGGPQSDEDMPPPDAPPMDQEPRTNAPVQRP